MKNLTNETYKDSLIDLQVKQNEQPEVCPCCDSADLKVLGQLGSKTWYRCNCCGMDFNIII